MNKANFKGTLEEFLMNSKAMEQCFHEWVPVLFVPVREHEKKPACSPATRNTALCQKRQQIIIKKNC